MLIRISGLVLGFREALEAFLVLAVLLRSLERSGRPGRRLPLWLGAGFGIAASVALGFGLDQAEKTFGGAEAYTASWALVSNLLALALITLFLVWMTRQGGDLATSAHRRLAAAPTPFGILTLAFFIVGREGAEVSLFAFAGAYPALSIALGVAVALALALLIQRSLVRIDLKTVFRATLVYLVLQAGYLAGSGAHEALSLAAATGAIPDASFLLAKLYDLSGTVLDRETGPVGVVLNILAGWNSDPEWPAFVLQYLYTAALLVFWSRSLRPAAPAAPPPATHDAP